MLNTDASTFGALRGAYRIELTDRLRVQHTLKTESRYSTLECELIIIYKLTEAVK